MRITAKVDYAVRASLELAAHVDGGPVKRDTIARTQLIPAKYLERILGELRRAGIVASQRGSDGGYRLAMSPEAVSIADIIRAVEGPLADVHGTTPEHLTYDGPAQNLPDVWIATRAALRGVLERVSLADVAAGTLPPDVSDLVAQPEAWARR